MKQKSFIKSKSIKEIIRSIIEENVFRVEVHLSKHDYSEEYQNHAGFKVKESSKKYFDLAQKGLINKETEDDLEMSAYQSPELDFPEDRTNDFFARMNFRKAYQQTLELCNYYCAMAMYFDIDKMPKSAIAYAIKASEVAGRLKQISFYSLVVPSTQENSDTIGRAVRSSNQRKNASDGGKKRHLDSPKSNEKLFVKKCWINWKMKPSLYKSLSAFARDMTDKCEHLKCDRVVISRWIKNEWQN